LLRTALSEDKANIAVVLAISFFINILGLTTAIYMLQVYDRVLASYSVDTLVVLTVIAAFALMTMSSLEAVRTGILQRTGARIADKLGPRVLGVQLADGPKFDAPAVQPLRDVETVRSAIGGPFAAALCDLPWSLMYFLLLYLLHPILFSVTLVFSVLLLGVALLNERMSARSSAVVAKDQLQALQFAESAMRAGEPLAAMGSVDAVTRHWHQRARKAALRALHTLDAEAAMHATARFLRWMLQILLLGGGAALAIAGELSAGGVIAASILGARAAAPIEGVIGSWRVAIAVRQAMERLGSLLGTSIPRLEGIALPRPTGRLLAERASVLLPNSQKLLFSGVSFKLAPGEQMAIIGPSGSGKSTLARAIIGLVPLATGNIRLDDVEVSAWRKRDLGRWIGYLPQTPIALMGSVSENIARLEPHADEEIIAAAREAGADAIIRSLPNGYDTPIGVGGVRLSGGQLQWVAIAGSLFGAPPLVVLDEPESHLDGDGETQLRSMLGRLRERQATVVIVSHRPAVVQVVDWLMVLRDGRAEFGQREEMMKRTLRISGSASG
jgi:PrtD family type I secretion system ABC transporter